jgi:hypothetical protein
MIRRMASISLGVVLCAGALVAQGSVRVLRLDFAVVNDGPGPDGKPRRIVYNTTVWMAPDGRERNETRNPEVSINRATLADKGRDIQIELDYDRKVAIRMTRFEERAKAGQPVGDHTFSRDAQKEELGWKKIQGFSCQGWRNRHGGLTTEHWFCSDPESGKRFLGSTLWSFPDGKSTARTDLVQVSRDVAVDPSIFEIPSDFRIIDK